LEKFKKTTLETEKKIISWLIIALLSVVLLFFVLGPLFLSVHRFDSNETEVIIYDEAIGGE